QYYFSFSPSRSNLRQSAYSLLKLTHFVLSQERPKKKKPDKSGFENGGERGSRTLDTLRYTHFPGVLLRPLGHLTIKTFRVLLQLNYFNHHARLRARYRPAGVVS